VRRKYHSPILLRRIIILLEQIGKEFGEIAMLKTIQIAVCRCAENVGVGRHDSCRRAPQGANPSLIYENLPIGGISFGGMSHAALQ